MLLTYEYVRSAFELGRRPLQAPGYRLISKTRLNGVSAARRKRVKPTDSNTFRSAASEASVPSAAPPPASAFGVHTSTDAAEKTRPTGLRLSSVRSPAIGSTSK